MSEQYRNKLTSVMCALLLVLEMQLHFSEISLRATHVSRAHKFPKLYAGSMCKTKIP